MPARGGFAEVDVSTDGVEGEIGHRLSRTWSIAGHASRSWRGQLQAGARLRGTW